MKLKVFVRGFLFTVVALLSGRDASARVAVFSLSVGYNGAPPNQGDLPTLHFADDDAASFHEYAASLTDRSILLTVFDTQSRLRFPAAASTARTPSLTELRRAVAELKAAADLAAAGGDEPVILLFYSGHGWQTADGKGGLALLDGELTHDILHEDVIAPLAGGFVHFFIDACHAEAVVRPRDRQAEVVDAPPTAMDAYLKKNTLARFPKLGLVMASTAGAEAHEWDGYGSGVFTHEILSGLRGAADVNGDQKIEYSELAAFVTAANRNVRDVRARPHTLVQPPALNPRAPIVDLRSMRLTAFLEGVPDSWNAFFIEDERGNRLMDLRAEASTKVRLALPAGNVLYVRNDLREAVLHPEVNQRLRFEDLRPAGLSSRARGALDTALRRGLFATRFGPMYYRGFVDRADEFVSVDLSDVDLSVDLHQSIDLPPSGRYRAARVAFTVAAAFAVVSGAMGIAAWKYRRDFDNTDLEAPAAHAQSRYELTLGLSLGALVTGAVAAGVGGYLLVSDRPR